MAVSVMSGVDASARMMSVASILITLQVMTTGS
jgi:hypothetical protein